MRIPPPIVTLLFGLMISGVDYWAPRQSSLPGLSWLSVLFGLAAALLLSSALVQFVRVNTTVNPYTPNKTAALIYDGVYRLSRNPMYLGMALCLAALTCYLENVFGFIFVIGFVWYMSHFQIRFEEQALLACFGSEFEDYCKRVRRWL